MKFLQHDYIFTGHILCVCHTPYPFFHSKERKKMARYQLPLFTLLFCLGNGFAQTPSSLKLTASDASKSDEFGIAVSLSGEYAVIGAHRDRPSGSYSGSAYVFKREGATWKESTKLLASDGDSYKRFGFAVAISGDYLIVGATGDNHGGKDTGAAYIFKRNGALWLEQAKLMDANGIEDNEFGYCVDLEGEYAVVGAWGKDSAEGRVFVYKRSGEKWSEHAQLSSSDARAGQRFGCAVTLAEESLVIGALEDDDRGASAGAAYVFARSGEKWSEQAKLFANDAAANDFFGASVSISGNTILVGKPQSDEDGNASGNGAAYVFIRNAQGWQQQAKLVANDAASGDAFGAAVALESDLVSVGAPLKNSNAENAGAAYLFKRSNAQWSAVTKLTATDGAAQDEFGRAVALSSGNVIAGAFQHDHIAVDAGAAYLFNTSTQTEVAQRETALPAAFTLSPNHPNPFQATTALSFHLTQAAEIEVTVFNYAGQKIKTLARSYHTAGAHRVQWEGKDEVGMAVASGLYFCKLSSGNAVTMQRMLLLKQH